MGNSYMKLEKQDIVSSLRILADLIENERASIQSINVDKIEEPNKIPVYMMGKIDPLPEEFWDEGISYFLGESLIIRYICRSHIFTK